MPVFVREALAKRGVRKAYDSRPPYQRNDYIAWIVRAVGEETKQKRLKQMLEELKKGGAYMRMTWKPKKNLNHRQ